MYVPYVRVEMPDWQRLGRERAEVLREILPATPILVLICRLDGNKSAPELGIHALASSKVPHLGLSPPLADFIF